MRCIRRKIIYEKYSWIMHKESGQYLQEMRLCRKVILIRPPGQAAIG
jgi:hypothetical protein